MNARRLILCLILAITAVVGGAAAARTWEETDRFPTQTEQTTQADDIQVAVQDCHVYVAVRRDTHVKLFTLLGQVIVQDTLHPGVYRYRLTSRGIYLLKAGSTTRRITL